MSENGLNKVMLIGRLGADPELRATNSGTSYLKMSLATTESYLDKNKVKQERTEWHRVTVWGKRADGLAKFLEKGHRLWVEGRIQTSKYEDNNGVTRYSTEVIAHDVNVLASPGRGGGGSSTSRSYDSGGPPDEPASSTGDGFDDDIPFASDVTSEPRERWHR